MDIRSSVSSSNKKIQMLVVDDDPRIRHVFGRIADRMDYHPIMARNASDALAVIRKGEVDLMLLDLNMPVVDGLELLNILRRYKLKVPTVIVSAFISSRALSKLYHFGIKNILSKPFKLGRLQDEIQMVLQDQEGMVREPA